MGSIKDIIRIIGIKPLPRHPADPSDSDYAALRKLAWAFSHRGKARPDFVYTSDSVPEEYVLAAVKRAAAYVNNRYDCSDFRVCWLLKLAYGGGKRLFEKSPENLIYKEIEACVSNAGYWISDGIEGSMCLYSENHQAACAAAEYLAGKMFNDTIFFDGGSGKEHARRGKERLILWCEQRFKYGYSEFLSHNYLPINAAVLALVLHYGDDAELKRYAAKALDILFYDFALHLYKNTFVGPQGRAYPRNNFNTAYSEYNADLLIGLLWGGEPSSSFPADELASFFIDMYTDADANGAPFYTVPPEIIEIGNYRGEMEVLFSAGLSLNEMQAKGLIGQNDNALMMQLGMGALTNPEVAENTLKAVERYNLWRNDFLSSMKFLDISFLKRKNRIAWLFARINAFPNGMALERHNVYTYKNDFFKLSSVQKYRVGAAGAQQTTMALTLDDGVTVYTANPARTDKWEQSPSYWGGYGAAPDCVQSGGVCLIIHKLPKRFFLAPFKTPDFTHTFFPTELFDCWRVDGKYAFAKKNGAVFALIGRSDFALMPFDGRIKALAEGRITGMPFDLVQKGRRQFTVYEASDIITEGGFDAFIERIKANEVKYAEGVLSYTSRDKVYVNKYGGGFEINGESVNLDFPRYRSVFGVAGREDEAIKSEKFALKFYETKETL